MPARWLQSLRAYTHETSRLQWYILILVALSLADLLVTYFLLQKSEEFYEGNPIARWFFHRWNIKGMIFFKFGVVASIVVVAELIERRRPHYGKFILIIGSIATAAVVLYGANLYFNHEEMPVFLDDE